MKKTGNDMWDENSSIGRSNSGSRVSRGSFYDKQYYNKTYAISQKEKAEEDMAM